MCIACGACRAADPNVVVQLNVMRQIFEPNSPGSDVSVSVCPSIKVDYGALSEFVFGKVSTNPLGVIDSIYLAQSRDYNRNLLASSGGLIKEVVAHLLTSGAVDAVLSITHADGLEYKARLVERPEEVDELPGSIYHSIDLSEVLATLIATDKKLGLIALPCQLEGIYSYVSKVSPELRVRIGFTIGLLCAWQYSRHSLAAIGSFYGFALDEIADVTYRGGGPIGRLRVKLRTGKEYVINRRASLFYQVAFDRYFNTPRCNVCINHTNYLADLVAGDSWIQRTRFSKTGVSLVICRTELATALVRQMAEQDRVVTVQATEGEIIESEGDRLVFGEISYPYADYLRVIGQWVPELKGPNAGSGRPMSRVWVGEFHAASIKRQELMYQGKYWSLFFEKLAREGHRIATRYVKWFVNRVLMLKKLTGKDRHLKASDFSEFR